MLVEDYVRDFIAIWFIIFIVILITLGSIWRFSGCSMFLLCMKPWMHVVITISELTFPFLCFDCVDKRIIFVFFLLRWFGSCINRV